MLRLRITLLSILTYEVKMKNKLTKQQTSLLTDASHEIIRLEASSNYTTFVMASGKSKIASYTLKKYDDLLSYPFLRVNKGCIVNLNFIKQFDTAKKIIELLDGTNIIIARRRYDEATRNIVLNSLNV